MRRKVICLQGFEYNETIYYTLEQLTDKNVIKDGIERGDVTFEYTTEELSDGGWKVTVYNIKFSKYVGKGIIQYKDTSTGKVTTVETNAKEGESYEFTINSEGNYDVIVTDAAEIAKIETIYLENPCDEIYNEPGLEEVAEKYSDLFLYEIIEGEEAEYWEGLPSKKARIIGMNPKYCNHITNNGYVSETGETYTDTNYEIKYNGETIYDTLVIPYQKEINGEIYRITEVDIAVYWNEIKLGKVYEGYTYPKINTLIYPNTVQKIYRRNSNGYESRNFETIYKVTLSKKLETIGDYMFYSCSALTDITIPKSVTSIGDDAFYGCNGLMSIKVEEGNTVYDSRNDCNAIIKTNTNELIQGCNNTVIPNGVTSIKDSAFSDCSSLISIEIPNSVTSIGNYAFWGCSRLTNIVIPNSVTSIGNSVFSECTRLTNITIPGSVTSMGYNVFNNWKSSQTINIQLKENEIPSTWSSYWKSGCSATINYL